MDRRPSENNLPSPMQFVAAANGPNMPAAVQLRTHEQPPHPGLGESLYSAINEIKSLKDQNKSLMTENDELKTELTSKDKALQRAKTATNVLDYASQEWRTRCEVMEKGLAANTFLLQELTTKLQEQEKVSTNRQVEVSRLQEELQEKTGLLDREIKKREARTKAHIDALNHYTSVEGQWKSRCDALEETHVSNSIQLQELNIKLQEQEHMLTNRQVEVSRLQEELQERTGLLDREIQKHWTRTKAHKDTLRQLSLKKTQLNRVEGQWKSRCDALEETHVSNSIQLQELNAKLQEQEKVLTIEQVEVSRLQVELQEKTDLLDREIQKRFTRTKRHVDTLRQRPLNETQLNRVEGQLKSPCDTLEENHVSNSTQRCSWVELDTWFANSPQLQELSAKLEAQEQMLTNRQVEVNCLQEELQQKTGLLKREKQKCRERGNAHNDTLDHLTTVQKQWKSRCDALEESHASNSIQLQELNIKLQEQEHMLTNKQVEVSRLQEELQEKTGLLDREIKKRDARTKAHIDALYHYTSVEAQWKSRCDALEETHVSNSIQLQELNAKLQEQEKVLTIEQVEVSRLQVELQEKTDLLDREIQKRFTRTKRHVDTLRQRPLNETQLNRVEGQLKSPCDTLEENHVSNSTQRCSWVELDTWLANSPQLQELSAKLEAQEQMLTNRQVEVNCLQEELQQKTGLLKREKQKCRERGNAHNDTLDHLTTVQKQWKSRCDALEESHASNSIQLQELNTKLQVQEQMLTIKQVEVSRLQEELQERTGLLDREIQKHRTRTNAQADTLRQPSLNRVEGQWKSRCDALGENHVSNSTQLQEVTKFAAQVEETKKEEEKIEKKREEESTKMDNDVEEFQQEGKSGERERKHTKSRRKKGARRRNH